MYLLKNLSFCHWFLLSFVLICFLLQWYKPWPKATWSWELNYLLVWNSLIIVHHCGKSIRSLGRDLKAGTEVGTTEKCYLLVCFLWTRLPSQTSQHSDEALARVGLYLLTSITNIENAHRFAYRSVLRTSFLVD